MPFFPEVDKIRYEGPDSKNPLAFRHYDPAEVVEGRSMKDHLRFGVAWWHTFRGMGGDPFGPVEVPLVRSFSPASARRPARVQNRDGRDRSRRVQDARARARFPSARGAGSMGSP